MRKFLLIGLVFFGLQESREVAGSETIPSSTPTTVVVEEYHKRFLGIMDGINADMAEFVSSALSGIKKHQKPRKLTDSEIRAIDKRIADLKPFVDKSDSEAQILAALFYEFKFDNLPVGSPYDCEMLNLLFKTAKGGYSHGAEILAKAYHEGRILPKDMKLAYFWGLEASRRNPDNQVKHFDGIKARVGTDRDKYKLEWMEWSPQKAADEFIDKNECPARP